MQRNGRNNILDEVERIQEKYIKEIRLLLRENYFGRVFDDSSTDFDAINRSILEKEMAEFKRELSNIDNFTELLMNGFSNYVLANVKCVLRDMKSELVDIIVFKMVYMEYLESSEENNRNTYNSARWFILVSYHIREETLQTWERKTREKQEKS